MRIFLFYANRMRVEFTGFSVMLWPFAVVALVILLWMLWRRKRSPAFLLCAALTGIYALYAAGILFFPIQVGGGYAAARRAVPFWSHANIIPFFLLQPDALRLNARDLALNIALTIPFGFALNFLRSMRPTHYLWLGPLVGLGIELTQLIISIPLGYLYRVVDINDVVMNALGIWLGYLCFRIFARLYGAVMHAIAFRQQRWAAK